MLSIKKTHFYRLLKEQAGDRYKKYIYLVLFSGLMQGLTVFSILHGLQALMKDGKVSFHMLVFYLLCLLGFYKSFQYVMREASLMALTGISQWRMRIAVKIRAVDMRSFENISLSKLQSAIIDSREVVIEASRMLVVAMSSMVMMLVSTAKMFSISLFGGCFILGLMILGGFRLIQATGKLSELQSKAIAHEMNFVTGLRNLIGGFSELKIHRDKTTELFTEAIEPDALKALEQNRKVESIYSNGMSFFGMLNYLVLGIALFFLPGFGGLEAQTVGQLMIVAMFCLSPLVGLVMFIPLLAKTEFNLMELVELEQQLDGAIEKCDRVGVDDNWRYRAVNVPKFESLRIDDLSFHYLNHAGVSQFGIHIDHFELNLGETVFIRGGNGSGKSTLMKVIAGLYTEYEGKLLFNERTVTENNIESYRNIFSSVFSDFHTFDRPLGIPRANLNKIDELLERMGLLHKVSLTDEGKFSSIDLSAGQKKRLALVCALLEGREVFLLDEIAADFDPEFRDFFYRVLLKELSATGATILAISHDDRYFDVADRVIAMDEGIIIDGNAL